MPTPLLPSRDDDEHVDGTVVLWKEFGYRPFLDGWNEDPTHKGGEDSVEGRWMPLDTYNALLARANTAKVAADLMRARAERAEALLWECRALFLNGPAFADLRSRVDSVLGAVA